MQYVIIQSVKQLTLPYLMLQIWKVRGLFPQGVNRASVMLYIVLRKRERAGTKGLHTERHQSIDMFFVIGKLYYVL